MPMAVRISRREAKYLEKVLDETPAHAAKSRLFMNFLSSYWFIISI